MSVDPGCAACWTTPGGCPVHWSPPSPQSSAYRPPVYGVENRSGGPGCHPECTDGWCHVAYVEGTPPNRDAQLARALAELSIARERIAALEGEVEAAARPTALLGEPAALRELIRRVRLMTQNPYHAPSLLRDVEAALSAYDHSAPMALEVIVGFARDLLRVLSHYENQQATPENAQALFLELRGAIADIREHREAIKALGF